MIQGEVLKSAIIVGTDPDMQSANCRIDYRYHHGGQDQYMFTVNNKKDPDTWLAMNIRDVKTESGIIQQFYTSAAIVRKGNIFLNLELGYAHQLSHDIADDKDTVEWIKKTLEDTRIHGDKVYGDMRKAHAALSAVSDEVISGLLYQQRFNALDTVMRFSDEHKFMLYVSAYGDKTKPYSVYYIGDSDVYYMNSSHKRVSMERFLKNIIRAHPDGWHGYKVIYSMFPDLVKNN